MFAIITISGTGQCTAILTCPVTAIETGHLHVMVSQQLQTIHIAAQQRHQQNHPQHRVYIANPVLTVICK